MKVVLALDGDGSGVEVTAELGPALALPEVSGVQLGTVERRFIYWLGVWWRSRWRETVVESRRGLGWGGHYICRGCNVNYFLSVQNSGKF